MILQILINVNRNAALQIKGIEIPTFYPIAAGKCSTRLLDSHWALLKQYRKVARKCPKAIENTLGCS
jgi:hypothetical protein